MSQLTNTLFTLMRNFSREAGEIALQYRGKVANIKKTESYDLAANGTNEAGLAKTIVDEMIQELFLSRLAPYRRELGINAEENTPLLHLFTQKKPKHFLHLDPVDGTLNYVSGKNDFAIGIAISDADFNFTHCVIHAPARGMLYAAEPDKKRALPKPVRVQDRIPPRLIYEKRLLSPHGRALVEKLGYTVITLPIASHLGIIDTAMGRVSAFLYGGSNVHDGMIPAPFAALHGVHPQDRFGRDIGGKNMRIKDRNGGMVSFHRIPSLCYFSLAPADRKKILAILSKKENLHPEYLKTFAPHEKKSR